MKKYISNIRTLAALLMAGATFAACSSDDSIIGEQPANQQVYTMTVNATKGDGATTRALSLDDSGAKNVLTATWATTENIYVKKGSDWAEGSLQPDADGATATLKGKLSGIEINPSDELILQFPKSGDISYEGQLGTLEDIAANFDYATASVTVESVSEDGNIIPTDATTTFESQQAIVKFTLVDKADENSLNATQLTVNDGTTDYIVNPVSEASEIYVAIPGISEQTVTLTATVDNDTYTYTKEGVTFTNGKYYEITVKMTKAATAIDLSMVDCAGIERTDGQWTANCYMVHKAGDYKLPLVYGNAIKNGKTNATAYKGVKNNSNATYNFPNHNGDAISAPWITKSTSGTDVNKGMGIAVTGAELLWQDAKGLITAVDIDGDYLTLTVGKDATDQEGNAVVAAKDADGNIVWSWHIWVTEQTFAPTDLTTVATGDHTYTVTPVNLGWVGDAVSKGYHTYYQWGRKDAFIPSTGTNMTNPTDHTVYDIHGTEVTGLTYSGTEVDIADNIKNPTTFYNWDGHPNSSTAYNLWDAKQTAGGNDDIITTATKKTVYDPSPAGFCVPTSNLLNYIYETYLANSSAWDDTNLGRIVTSVTPNLFFPASARRVMSSGEFSLAGNGFYWTASPNEGKNGRYLRVYNPNTASSIWGYGPATRSQGFPVRAVAEE